MTNNSRRVPPFQPIGDRTTFRIKLRPNIQAPSIKGVVKIQVIIIKSIKKESAHKFLVMVMILIGTTKESRYRI